jgi:hypothetical protein
MIAKGPAVPTAVATAVIGLAIGGVIGFYVHASQWQGSSESDRAESARARSAPVAGAPAGGGGRGGGAGGQQPSSKRDLTDLVGSLGKLEKVQNKGLTAAQKTALASILKKLQSAEKLTDDDCKTELASINGVLTADQQDAVKALAPQRGGSSGGGTTAAPDPNKPFAVERNKKALEDLIGAVQM